MLFLALSFGIYDFEEKWHFISNGAVKHYSVLWWQIIRKYTKTFLKSFNYFKKSFWTKNILPVTLILPRFPPP